MDRQGHDYAMAYAQQQQQQQQAANNIPQQFGFHPQHQQFPPTSVHGPPFVASHPPIQRFPYPPHPIQQQQQQPPHPPPNPHMPPTFPPFNSHLIPLMTPTFPGQYDSPPPSTPPPSDPEQQKIIDKLVEYIVKNGPQFEAMIREKQQDNPGYSFLFGGDGHGYYRYKLWLSTHPAAPTTFSSNFASPMIHPPPNPMMNASGPMLGGPHMHQPGFPPFYEQPPHHQAFMVPGRSDYDHSSKSFRGLSGPLPSDVAVELNNVVSNLSGTKEAIKGAKVWFMQRAPFAPALAEALKDRIFALDDSERQLHIIYLANDILFDSLQRRINPVELDNEAHAFRPVLGSMLARIYHNQQNKDENQSRLQKIVHFWASKEVYDQETIRAFEAEMMSGPPSISADSGMTAKQRQPDNQIPVASIPGQEHFDRKMPSTMPPNLVNQQFLPSSIPGSFPGSIPIISSIPPVIQQPISQLSATPVPGTTDKLPPYPLFPPGLIPGMVRKMQIGSGVPYSPMSPLDIPTAIPPSNVSTSETLERVSKFFKEIGEVNPSEGPMKSDLKDDDDYDQYEREPMVRKGGACIPPPSSLNTVDPESGTYADGSVERKPGSSGGGRLGLGATANPNEVSQYDDVYSSYRKQISTNYHTSMSARASAR